MIYSMFCQIFDPCIPVVEVGYAKYEIREMPKTDLKGSPISEDLAVKFSEILGRVNDGGVMFCRAAMSSHLSTLYTCKRYLHSYVKGCFILIVPG